MDGPKTGSNKNHTGGGGRKPTTTSIEVKDNKVTKKTGSGKSGESGGRQGKYAQPY